MTVRINSPLGSSGFSKYRFCPLMDNKNKLMGGKNA